jgi:hypothetical protein
VSLTTTQLSEHFGVSMSADFVINTLGITNTGKEKRAFLWDESQLADIGSALAAHVTARSKASVSAPSPKAPKKTKVSGGAADDLF